MGALADAGAKVDEVLAGFGDEPAAQDGAARCQRFARGGRIEMEGGVGSLDHRGGGRSAQGCLAAEGEVFRKKLCGVEVAVDTGAGH